MPKTYSINSENSAWQHLEVLKRNREKRHRSREFLVEGVALINEMRQQDWPVVSYVYSSKRGLSEWAKGILAASEAAQHLDLKPELLEKISDKENASEILAVARMGSDDPERIPVKQDGVVVVLDRPASPGNLGSTLRSCNAFEVDGVIVTGHAADLYDPVAVRSSLGALFAMPVIRLESATSVAEFLKNSVLEGVECRVVGTSAKGTQQIDEVDFNNPTMLLLGNETFGLSVAFKELCTTVASIPICGVASSLNVSCAGSVALYEIRRQRRRH